MNAETSLNLRLGGTYRTRGGSTARVFEILADNHLGLHFAGTIDGVSGVMKWGDDGKVYGSYGDYSIDIVAEIDPEPEPEVSHAFGSPESWAEVEKLAAAELPATGSETADAGKDDEVWRVKIQPMPYSLAEPPPAAPPGVIAITAALRTLVAAIEFHAEELPVPVGDAVTLSRLALGTRA